MYNTYIGDPILDSIQCFLEQEKAAGIYRAKMVTITWNIKSQSIGSSQSFQFVTDSTIFYFHL